MFSDDRRQGVLRYLLLAGAMVIGPFVQRGVERPDSRGTADLRRCFQEFSDRVPKVPQSAQIGEGTLPKVEINKATDGDREASKAPGKENQSARAHAKRGDIFTPAASEEFKKTITNEFQSPRAPIHKQPSHRVRAEGRCICA